MDHTFHNIGAHRIEMTSELMGHILIEVTARLTRQNSGSIYDSLDQIILAEHKKLTPPKAD